MGSDKNNPGSLNLPLNAVDQFSSIGLLGSFHLEISPDAASAELFPLRSANLGESYVISGKSYFTTQTCSDCLRISSIGLDNKNNINVGFSIKHPFDKGDPSAPPSGKNRLDLDIFDVALLIEPIGNIPETFPLIDVDVFTDTVLNPDGYSGDLGAILPYKMCYVSPDNNRFEMGTLDQDFPVTFAQPGLSFNLYLTMAYGVSATFHERLEPTYFVPEFNRKSAWKIDVTAAIWDGDDPETVIIDIYDWNHGADIAADFPDVLNTDFLSAPSDIFEVVVEIPGMNNEPIIAETADTTSNGWDDPLTYTASFSNENGLADGFYTGIVKVTDSRIPGEAGQSDSLIISPDGKNLEYSELTEFACYQSFSALISSTHFTRTWGGTYLDVAENVALDSDGNIYITGAFSGTVDFDPGPGEEWRYGAGFSTDVYVMKLDSGGQFLWVRTWGSDQWDNCWDIEMDSSRNIYLCGLFGGTVDFDPGFPSAWRTSEGSDDVFVVKFDTDGNFIWVLTWGGLLDDFSFGLTVDESSNALYTTGYFRSEVDFDTGAGEDQRVSVLDSEDIFLTKHDLDGNYQWAVVWGDDGYDLGFCVAVDNAGNVYPGGSFEGTVDFDPGLGEDFHTAVSCDVFFSRFDSDGNFLWANTFGGDDWDECYDLLADGSSNIYVAGYYSMTVDFDPGPGEDWHTSVGDCDSFLGKYLTNGELVWAKTWGGFSWECGYRLAFDNDGMLLISGDFESTTDFDPGPDVENRSALGVNDIYLSQFDTNGNFYWVQNWGSVASDGGWGLAVDSSNHIVICGTYGDEIDFNLGYGEDIHPSYGQLDCFVSKFIPIE